MDYVPSESLCSLRSTLSLTETDRIAAISNITKPRGKVKNAFGPTRPLNFLTDRRISESEMQRRHDWMQEKRLSVDTEKTRSHIKHEVRFPESYEGMYSTRFSADGQILATGFGTGCIQIRSGINGDLRKTVRCGLKMSYPIMCCRFDPIRKNIFYASSACGHIFLCMTDCNDYIQYIKEPKNEINTIDVNVRGDRIATGGKDATLRLYDAETGRLITSYAKNKNEVREEKVKQFHSMRIFAAKFHETNSDLLVTGGWDDTVRIWDIRNGDGSVRVIKGPHICGDAIDMKGNNIITGSWVVRGSLQLWDLTSAKLINTIKPQNRPTSLDGEFLYALQYFDNDPTGDLVIVGGSGIGAVEVISLRKQIVLGTYNANKAVLTVGSYQSTIVYGGMESTIRLADFS